MSDRPAAGGWRGAAKRAIDVIGSGVALVMLAPLLVAVAVAVRLALGLPVLFHQQRTGRHGRPFQLVKFRTMLPRTSATEDDAGRLTPFGRWAGTTGPNPLGSEGGGSSARHATSSTWPGGWPARRSPTCR